MPQRRPGAAVWPLLLLVGVIVNVGIVRGSSTIDSYFELRKSSGILGERVDGLKKENEDLSAEIMRLKKSPDYARKVLRDKYHVTDADESIVFFAD